VIEIGIFDTGALDMPFKTTANGVRVMDGSLADIHRYTQEMMKAAVRRCVLADKLGYDIYWLVEHHFRARCRSSRPPPC
jgi:hypothetical protein